MRRYSKSTSKENGSSNKDKSRKQQAANNDHNSDSNSNSISNTPQMVSTQSLHGSLQQFLFMLLQIVAPTVHLQKGLAAGSSRDHSSN